MNSPLSHQELAQHLYVKHADLGQSKNQNCDKIAAMLRISGKYFLQILNGTRIPANSVYFRMQKLHHQTIVLPKKRRKKTAYKPRLVISYDDPELQSMHMELSNKERIEALSQYLKQKP